jgi:hypothetical protein
MGTVSLCIAYWRLGKTEGEMCTSYVILEGGSKMGPDVSNLQKLLLIPDTIKQIASAFLQPLVDASKVYP